MNQFERVRSRIFGSKYKRALVMGGSVLSAAGLAHGQSGAETSGRVRIDSIRIIHDSTRTPEPDRRRLEASLLRSTGVFPGRSYDSSEIDLALSRIRSSGIANITREQLSYGEDGGLSMALTVREPDSPPPARPSHWSDDLTLIDAEQKFLKVRVGLKGAFALSGNQWLNNGDSLTQFNPRGQFDGGRGPNGVLDLAPSVGLAGAIPLSKGPYPSYIYGNVLYLSTATIGQDNNRSNGRFTGQWEEAYTGIVDSGVTSSGLVWRSNISFGRMPYCIGNGMLICQIASSGGDRGADFAWPRWTGSDFLKVQLRINQTLIEAFSFEPNDAPSTDTRLSGLNIDHVDESGRSLGFTWLKANKSELRYFFPNGDWRTRDGLNAWHVRGHWKPVRGESGLIGRLEYAKQNHDDFDMKATGYSAEGGWQFSGHPWRPSLTYRVSSTTGDDPTTSRYERWDLLYSGNDIDTWVQGQLMKNIHYNSNVQVHRILLRGSPDPKWRLTTGFSTYRANQLNNIGGVISTLANRDLGKELLFVAEHYVSRNIYWRFTTAGLWPGSGITRTLPRPASKPWLVAIAQFNINY